MSKKPKLIKLNNTPSIKDVEKILLPPIEDNQYDLSMSDDVYIRPDRDSIYRSIKNEDHKKNNP